VRLPKYNTPIGFCCPECGEECSIVALDTSFAYSGTHCTNGMSGIHYPQDYGIPVTDCCEAFIEDAEEVHFGY
jgi:hypothetical protein